MSTLTFYMKSGNSFKVRGVKTWKINYSGDNITSLTINRSLLSRIFIQRRLIMGSLNLSQIEAILES